ncbi:MULTISPECIES: DUF1697 domain-containing protein [unclassified Leucobacter]|uniref:DUF1697 domain-containing protein n=1 Tax=unclassified Leucobacter TaxID=2621730 RepID=UPI000622A0CD|nr:DUF1697 domain-containing protein [Leucobacter sp. Ag1]KKI20937.1 hypothetical protein XM48_06790 [Leucobacter sp. Ag1]
MARWIALLRGVNVNGITVRSAELAGLFRELGFGQVRTVLASGNVCFDADEVDGSSDAARTELKARIERALGERFGYDAWIVLVPLAELDGIIAGYPFAEDPEHHAYVVFAADADALHAVLTGAPGADPGAADPDAEASGNAERFAAGPGVVYWRCPRGGSTDTPFSKHIARARFKTSTTTRNINTLRKLG